MVKIIAEIGVNHNGSLDIAYELIDVAVRAQADIVKFQSFKAHQLVTPSAPLAKYQKAEAKQSDSQLNLLSELELSDKQHIELKRYCDECGIEFLSTPFSIERLNFLLCEGLIKRIKVPSGEITNLPLIVKAGATRLPVILSTGMANQDEIKEALAMLNFGRSNGVVPLLSKDLASHVAEKSFFGINDVTVLQCVTQYPATIDTANLRLLREFETFFGVDVGFSDHTPSLIAPALAVSLGASVIEKHITLSHDLKGPDHKASLLPSDFVQMCQNVRIAQKALGSTKKIAVVQEKENLPVARKSIVAKRAIRKGEVFTENHIETKRPGTGLSPKYFWDLVGKTASVDYQQDEFISEDL